MADNTPQGKISGIKQAWRSPKARKGIIAAGVVMGLILVISFITMSRQNSKPVGPPATAMVVAPPTGQGDVTGKTQENYKELVRAADLERAEKLKSSSTAMVLPRVTGMSDPDQVRKEEETRLAAERGKARALQQAAAVPPVRNSAQAAGVAQQQQQQQPIDPNLSVRQSDSYRISLALLQRVANQGNTPQGGFSPLMTPPSPPATGPGNGAGSTQGQGASMASSTGLTASQLRLSKPLVRAGEVAYANTDIALNSDYSGPINVTIREGKFSGARLIGQKALERDAVVIRFNTLSPADGSASFPVQAYAVALGDAKTFGLTGIQGETDYHVMERYVMPGAISFVQAFGLSASQKGSTAVAENGSVGTSTPGLTKSDRVAVALGSAMTPLLNDIRQRGARPITVSLPAGTEIGVMFGADVQDPATMRANAASTTEKTSIMGMPSLQDDNGSSVRMLQQNAARAMTASNDQSQLAMQQYQQSYNAGGPTQPSYSNPQGGYQPQPQYGGYQPQQPQYGAYR